VGPREDATVETNTSKDIYASSDPEVVVAIFFEIKDDVGGCLDVVEGIGHSIPGGSVWYYDFEDEQRGLDRLAGDHDADRLRELQTFSPSGTDGVGEVVDQLLWSEVHHRKGGHGGWLERRVRLSRMRVFPPDEDVVTLVGGREMRISIHSVRSEASGVVRSNK
jgi:hypothetical protein